MNRCIVSSLLFFLLPVAFSQQKTTHIPDYLRRYAEADDYYHQAEQFSLSANYNSKTEDREKEMNRHALNIFQKILPDIEKDGNDSLTFHCYYKIGTLQHYFENLIGALEAYNSALRLKAKLPSLPNSFLFRLHLFIGGIQYSRNLFDSAFLNYKKAEEITSHYPGKLGDVNRLYNTLGAMYHETGNYRQAKNYFEKAIELLNPGEPSYADLLVNYKINLAATLTRLEEFAGASALYQRILPLRIHTNDILHNIGTVNLKMGNSSKAIQFFKRVRYANIGEIRLLNDIGQAYDSLQLFDSARHYYRLAVQENQKWNGQKKNVQAGLTLKYIGDELKRENKSREALEYYQRSLLQFSDDFHSSDIFQNPDRFSGVFSYINLFYVLTAKAAAFELLYRQQKNLEFLEASLDAYRSAFSLAGYVERTYDSDEARLFLNKIKYSAHSKPIDVSLLLYHLTQKRSWLEETYYFDQRNKASILSLNVQENEWKNKNVSADELFTRQGSLRSAITRLSLKKSQLTDSTALQSTNASIRDLEIELGKVQDKIGKDPVYREKQFSEYIPAVNELQEKLDHQTAILSYHLSGKELLTLLITDNKFDSFLSPLSFDFFDRINSLKSSLHNTSPEQRFNGAATSSALYNILISPLEPSLLQIGRLIIIPDDELNYLPFEALRDVKGKYLVERFSIQYQYSTALLGKGGQQEKAAGILAFAPFVSGGFTDSSGNILSPLPASKEEVSKIKGKIYTDSAALKPYFLNSANHYGIIHLATHASVDNGSPLRSFITFYPVEKKRPDDYRLYAQEIYNMNLDSTQLIILSACETGAGQLVKGEGLMSLARAFAYAGCPNIITSLWKAEDRTTAFITQRLHHYLSIGYQKDKALQQAKIDLLHNNEIDPRFKTPNYWAHLLFIGQYEPERQSSGKWRKVIAVIIVAAIYFFYRRKKLFQMIKEKGLTQRR